MSMVNDWKNNLRGSLFYDSTGNAFMEWADKNNLAFVDTTDFKEIERVLVGYDLVIKKQLLNYGIEHSVHAKICEELSEIRNECIKQIKENDWKFGI